MSKVYQRPVQISIPFHDALGDLANDTGINMKRLVEDALADKYPKLRKLKGSK
jgi:hypothetical protein